MAQHTTKKKTKIYDLEELEKEHAVIKSELKKLRTLEKYERFSTDLKDTLVESSFAHEINQLLKDLRRISNIKYKLNHKQEMKIRRSEEYANKQASIIKERVETDPTLLTKYKKHTNLTC